MSSEKKRYEYNGKSLTLEEWSKELNISRKTLWKRIHQGMPVEIALSMPLRRSYLKVDTKTRLRCIWNGMIKRCDNPKNSCYRLYGEKGIRVCYEWYNFDNFYSWALSNGYDKDLSIDRIDSSKGYYPENCRWATRKQQSDNTSQVIYITYNGKTQPLSDWSRELGIKNGTLYWRYHQGWSVEEMFAKTRFFASKYSERKASKGKLIYGTRK